MDGSVPNETQIFTMLELPFPQKLNLDSHIVSVTKIASKKIRVLMYSTKLLFVLPLQNYHPI